MSTVVKDLGAVSAYAYAVEKGYTGTEAEFAELMASYAEVGQAATNAAESALNSKTAAQTAATTATNKASEATTAAQTATTKAGEASQSASDANTAKEEAVTAKTAAETAQGKAEDAQAAAESVAESIPSDYSQLSEDVSDLKEDLSAIVTVTVGKNLVNPNKLTPGMIQADGTIDTIGAYASYNTSDFIGIDANTSYVLSAYWQSDGSLDTNRKGYLLYSADKNPLNDGYVSTTGKELVIANTDALYIRIFFRKNSNGQFEKGSSRTAYEEYTTTSELNDSFNLTQTMRDELNDAFIRDEVGKNKFNPETAIRGYIATNAGVINQTIDTYNTTDFIDISGFVNSICVSPRLKDALQYDADKNAIPTTYIETITQNAVIPVAEGAHYIRVSYWSSESGSVQIEDNTTPTTYEPYTLYVEEGVNCLNETTEEAVEQLIGNKARNVLFGKKWIPFGDSFTDYTNKTFASGAYSGQMASYPRLIAERNGMTIDQNFFRSGRTLAYPADGTFTNSATCPTNSGYYQNIPADADYITIMLGINDLNHQSGSGTSPDGEDQTGVITLGTIDDETTATYYGAWNVVLGWLRQNRPFAHIGIIVTNGTQSQGFVEAQIAEAKKWGYPYINLNGDERTPAFIRCYNPNLPYALKESLKSIQGVDAPSNTHPNWQTHELESTIIEAWLRSL